VALITWSRCVRPPWQLCCQHFTASTLLTPGSHQPKIENRGAKYSFLRLPLVVSILTPDTPLIIYFQAGYDGDKTRDARAVTADHLSEYVKAWSVTRPRDEIHNYTMTEGTRHKILQKLSTKSNNIVTLNNDSNDGVLSLLKINLMNTHSRDRSNPAVGAQYPTVWEYLTLVLRNYNG
jgi:hypothetical protein